MNEGVAVEGEGTVQDVTGLYGEDPVENGRITYMAYCASCHGEEARGDGPVAPELNTPPGDLRHLARANGGAFPTDAVYQTIDGRESVRAHGSREMPVWGNVWIEQGGRAVHEDAVEHRINELVEYLRSVQDTTAAGS